MPMRLAFLFAASVLAAPAAAQSLADTLFTWKGYARPGQCRVLVYETPPDEDRSHVVILQEVAANAGPSVLDDVRYLAEHVGRALGLDPANAFWVVHWGSFSFEGAADTRKEVLLRATFRRTKSGSLGAPSWRVVTREEVEALTDRQF